MWHLIYNNLKVLIDPLVFADRGIETISKQVNLVDTFQHYLTAIDPSLCGVTFFFPRFAETKFGLRRTFIEGNDKITFIDEAPPDIIEVIKEPSGKGTERLAILIRTHNECISVAVNNKCAYMLTAHPFNDETKAELRKKYNLELVTLDELQVKIGYFLQGFYNYFKFSNPIYGISSPDIAHAMSDTFFQQTLLSLESKFAGTNPAAEARERMRSFVHNRYIDILITVDQISFFKIQQHIHDAENAIVENKHPFAHGYIRYYLNYYLFLLWGATDHLAWLINDLFGFGYNPENGSDRGKVGLRDSEAKKEFLAMIKGVDPELHAYITSKEIQEWLYFFGQLRHKNSHREMFSASPLMVTTPESEVSDEEIDKILYEGRPVIEEEDSIKRIMPEELFRQLEENQKAVDRTNYRISKMKKGIDHFAMVQKDGKGYMFNPVDRMPGDIKYLRELIGRVAKAYGSR